MNFLPKVSLSNEKLFWMLCFFWLLISLFLRTYSFDFSLVWKAAGELAQGRDPYRRPHYATFVEDYPLELKPDPTSADVSTYYPPAAIAQFIPFSFLTLRIAKKIAFFLCGFTVLYSIFSSSALVNLTRSWRKNFSGLLLFLPLGIILNAIQWGSPSWLMLLGLSLFVSLYSRGHFFCAGLSLFLTLLKPQIAAATFVSLLVFVLKNKQTKVIYGVIFAAIMLNAVAISFYPQIFANYFELIRRDNPMWMTNATLPSYLSHVLLGSQGIYSFIPGIFVILLGVWFALRTNSLESVLQTIPLISIPLAPFGWGHDYLICLPGLLYLFREFQDGRLKKEFAYVIFVSNIIALGLSVYFFVPGWSYLVCGIGYLVVGLGQIQKRGAVTIT